MSTDSKTFTALILEDESAQQDRLAQLIRTASSAAGTTCAVECRSDAQEARQLLTNGFLPKLVIIDHALFGADNGLTFFQHLLDTKATCQVLILSSRLMQTDATRQLIWSQYRALMAKAEAAGAGIRIDIREKDPKYTAAKAWVPQAVSNCVLGAPRAPTVHWNALKPIVAVSEAMSKLKQEIESFLREWQAGQRHILILHGDKGVGKRFLGCCVADAAGITGAAARMQVEEALFAGASTFQSLMEHFTPAALTGGAQQFEFTAPSNAKKYTWSQIVPDMSEWPNPLPLARLTAEKIAQYPHALFIWLFETSWYQKFGHELTALQRTARIVHIPPFHDRGRDMARLALELCPDLQNRNLSLGKTAASMLEMHPPASPSALRTAISVAINTCPTGAKEISASDLPWTSTTLSDTPPRPQCPQEISCYESTIIMTLQEQRAVSDGKTGVAPLAFGNKLAERFDPPVCKVIRAVAWASASKVWASPGRHTNGYLTLYPKRGGGYLTWPAVAKGADRNEITDFARQHRDYLLWLASEHGPSQPQPSS